MLAKAYDSACTVDGIANNFRRQKMEFDATTVADMRARGDDDCADFAEDLIADTDHLRRVCAQRL